MLSRSSCLLMYVSVKSQICFCFHYFTYNLFLSRSTHCRLKWQLIRALQMFVEHVVLKHEGMLPYLRRLQLVSIYFSCAHIYCCENIPFPHTAFEIWCRLSEGQYCGQSEETLELNGQWIEEKVQVCQLLRSRLYQVAVKLLSHGIYEWSRQLWDSFSDKTRTKSPKLQVISYSLLVQVTNQEAHFHSEQLSCILHGAGLHTLLWYPLSPWATSHSDAHKHSIQRAAGNQSENTRIQPLPRGQEWWSASHPVFPSEVAPGAQVSGQLSGSVTFISFFRDQGCIQDGSKNRNEITGPGVPTVYHASLLLSFFVVLRR